jgi:hypothetical protein
MQSAWTGRQMKPGSQKGLRRMDACSVRSADFSICSRRSNFLDMFGFEFFEAVVL